MLEKFPGYLGLTSKGVIAIHADWPTYPAEHRWEQALLSFGSFEVWTRFRPISDIDRCILFLGWGGEKDPFGEDALHVAIWHEDLLSLAARGMIEGVKAVTEREWELNRRKELRESIRRDLSDAADNGTDALEFLFNRTESGEMAPVRLPDLEEFDDEEPHFPSFSSTGGAVIVTREGWERLDSLLVRSFRLPPSVQPRLLPILSAGLLDAAVRELAVCLETRLRSITGSDAWGKELVEAYLASLMRSGRYLPAGLKALRCELASRVVVEIREPA